jgi:hypothetical protein
MPLKLDRLEMVLVSILLNIKEIAMPVMGPNQDYAYEIGDKATDRILQVLKEEFGVFSPNDKSMFKNGWDTLSGQLREVVKELVWNDHMDAF